jgi:beta-glucosidase
VTFYKGVEQLPEFTDYSMAKRTYRYFEGEPLFPFGFGLSYSTFAYSGLKLSTDALPAGEPLHVEATVANTSRRDGDAVVQLYLSVPGQPGAPRRALRGFTRVRLKAGESQVVRFTLGERDLSSVNADGQRLVGAGRYGLAVGGGQPGTGAPVATAEFEIRGDKALPR